MSNELVTARYDALLEDIVEIYQETKKTLAEAYWRIGERIVRVEQNGEVRAAYGQRLLERISEDLLKRHGLGFSPVNLGRMRTFYLSYPKSSAPKELTWTHYVELLGVADQKTRGRLEKLAAREGLSSRELRRLVNEEQGGRSGSAADLSPLRRPGNLTFNTCAPAFPVGLDVAQGSRAVDLGFGVQVILSEEALQNLSVTSRPSYTYPATVERVVDGDTFLVEVDLGLGILVRQRLRLRGVDAPELKTAEGLKARDAVMRLISRGSLIVIRSHKTDIYGRYVADVLYLKEETDREKIAAEGNFLNQELLDEGLAVRMK